MRRIAHLAIATFAITALACAKSGEQTADTGMAAAMMPAAISVADVAGTWTVTAWNERRDSVLVTSELMATADTTAWMMHLPNRNPIPVRILSVAGDSIVTESGPYESVLRKGIQVTTHSVYRLQDGKLVGTTVARYTGAGVGADSVRTIPVEGTRKP